MHATTRRCCVGRAPSHGSGRRFYGTGRHLDKDGFVSRVHVSVLSEWDQSVVAELARLLPQVSASAPSLTAARVEEVVLSPSTHVVVARLDGTIVAMALLLVCTTFAGGFGMAEEVAVDKQARGRHVSVHLMVGLLHHAAELGLRFVDLTSRPSRLEANSLYTKLGFNVRDTNCYRHALDPIPEPW